MLEEEILIKASGLNLNHLGQPVRVPLNGHDVYSRLVQFSIHENAVAVHLERSSHAVHIPLDAEVGILASAPAATVPQIF